MFIPLAPLFWPTVYNILNLDIYILLQVTKSQILLLQFVLETVFSNCEPSISSEGSVPPAPLCKSWLCQQKAPVSLNSVCVSPSSLEGPAFSCTRWQERVVFAKLLLVAWLLSCNRGVLALTFASHRHDNRVQNYDVAPSRRFLWALLSNYFQADYLFKDGSSTISPHPTPQHAYALVECDLDTSHQDVGFCPAPLTPCLRSG